MKTAKKEAVKKKAIWISYDFGVNGAYEDLYKWLDKHGAKECGDSNAFLTYKMKTDLAKEVKADLQKNVEIRSRDRIYLTYLKDGKMKGTFLFGKRKSAPWKGSSFEGDDEEDE